MRVFVNSIASAMTFLVALWSLVASFTLTGKEELVFAVEPD